MNRFTVSLKTRVRYGGLVRTLDRRSNQADLEKLPDHFWFVVGQVLRSKFRKPVLSRKAKSVRVTAKKEVVNHAPAPMRIEAPVEVAAVV